MRGGAYGTLILTEELPHVVLTGHHRHPLATIRPSAIPQGRPAVDPRTHHRHRAHGRRGHRQEPLYSDLDGLTGFTAEISDDGRFALVEFVAKESKFLTPLANSGQRQARKDSPNKDAVLEDFKRYKRNFKPERFGLAIPQPIASVGRAPWPVRAYAQHHHPSSGAGPGPRSE